MFNRSMHPLVMYQKILAFVPEKSIYFFFLFKKNKQESLYLLKMRMLLKAKKRELLK